MEGFNLTLYSSASGATINAQHLSRIFRLAQGAHLVMERIHLVNGNSSASPQLEGGAIRMTERSTALLTGCSISNCAATLTWTADLTYVASPPQGGAIFAERWSSVVLHQSVIKSCVTVVFSSLDTCIADAARGGAIALKVRIQHPTSSLYGRYEHSKLLLHTLPIPCTPEWHSRAPRKRNQRLFCFSPRSLYSRAE